jgi:uncharacterized protein YndB with AHSA1/START domain
MDPASSAGWISKENYMTVIKEVSFERIYNAPVEKVWQAWTDPNMIKQWWGPNDVTIPECEIDLKVGGRLYIVMEAGEAMGEFKGTRWPMEAKFTEIVPNSKLAYSAKAWTEGAAEATEIETETMLILTEEGGKTKINLRSAILKTGPQAQMAVQGMQYGFEQQLAKLEKYLA